MNKPRLRIALFLIVVTIASCQRANESHQQHTGADHDVAADTTRKSIPRDVHAIISGASFSIKYHAPAVRGRTIWGGLVPLGEVWVTGAHSATTLEFDKDIVVDNRPLPAGKYALFTIPDSSAWTIVINRNWDQHLADEYDQKDDVMRTKVTPLFTDKVQERLIYKIVDKGNTAGAIELAWEKVRIGIPFTVR